MKLEFLFVVSANDRTRQIKEWIESHRETLSFCGFLEVYVGFTNGEVMFLVRTESGWRYAWAPIGTFYTARDTRTILENLDDYTQYTRSMIVDEFLNPKILWGTSQRRAAFAPLVRFVFQQRTAA